jgi:hypothetical protein
LQAEAIQSALTLTFFRVLACVFTVIFTGFFRGIKMAVYNYGLGNKDMARAGHNALLRDNAGRSFSSIDTLSRRWGQFCEWARGQGIKRMEKIGKDDVVRYGAGLAEKVRSGEMEASTAQNYVSAVNTVLQIARADGGLRHQSADGGRHGQQGRRRGRAQAGQGKPS